MSSLARKRAVFARAVREAFVLYHHPPRPHHRTPQFGVLEVVLITAIVLLVLGALLIGRAASVGP